MAKRKRTKYNNGSLVQQTIKTNVADLNLNYSPPSQHYSADVSNIPKMGNTRFGVQGRGFNSPSSVHASTRIGGAEVQGSYNLESNQPTVKITKSLGPRSNVQFGYEGSTGRGGGGIGAMYNLTIPLSGGFPFKK